MSVNVLFEELVSRWTREDPLHVDELLERAGPDADELARLIDAFLERAPRREPTQEARAAIAALTGRLEHEPPLLSARIRARRRVSDVVQAIVSACELPATAEELVRSYYQRLEGGLLDPRGVSGAIWAALGKLFGLDVRKLAQGGFSPPRAATRPAILFQRAASSDFSSGPAPAAETPSTAPDDVRRRVDQLFTGESAD
jgi:hypothetical protein